MVAEVQEGTKIVKHVFNHELEASCFVLHNNLIAQHFDNLACFELIFTSLIFKSQ